MHLASGSNFAASHDSPGMAWIRPGKPLRQLSSDKSHWAAGNGAYGSCVGRETRSWTRIENGNTAQIEHYSVQRNKLGYHCVPAVSSDTKPRMYALSERNDFRQSQFLGESQEVRSNQHASPTSLHNLTRTHRPPVTLATQANPHTSVSAATTICETSPASSNLYTCRHRSKVISPTRARSPPGTASRDASRADKHAAVKPVSSALGDTSTQNTKIGCCSGRKQ